MVFFFSSFGRLYWMVGWCDVREISLTLGQAIKIRQVDVLYAHTKSIGFALAQTHIQCAYGLVWYGSTKSWNSW